MGDSICSNEFREFAAMTVFRKIAVFAIAFAGLIAAACERSTADSDTVHAGPVMNYHRIDERLVTGGHIVDDGLATLKAEGVTVVIDLRDKPPRGQKEKLAQQGIEWINVPIKWDDPKTVDFERFTKAMQEHQGDHVLVQCAANYRASAMTYLYRVLVEQVDESEATEDLYAVWTPSEKNQQWSEYIEGIKASER
jgi:protein tyrosine phosphatase (PTP) superfamily phosphohydrolase (DUF442 family)